MFNFWTYTLSYPLIFPHCIVLMLEENPFFHRTFCSRLFQQFHRSLMILTLSEMFKHKTRTISWDGASVEAPFNQMEMLFFFFFFFLHPVQHISPKSSLTHLISLKTLKTFGTSYIKMLLDFPECACILLIKILSLKKNLVLIYKMQEFCIKTRRLLYIVFKARESQFTQGKVF